MTVENASVPVGNRPRNIILPPYWERHNHTTSPGFSGRSCRSPTYEHSVLGDQSVLGSWLDNHQNTPVA